MQETHNSIWQRTKTEKKHLRLKYLQIDGWPLWFDCYKKRRVSGNSKHLDQGQIARNCQESSMRLQAKVSKAKEKRICSKMLVPLPSANSWSRILRELKTCRKRVACWAGRHTGLEQSGEVLRWLPHALHHLPLEQLAVQLAHLPSAVFLSGWCFSCGGLLCTSRPPPKPNLGGKSSQANRLRFQGKILPHNARRVIDFQLPTMVAYN